MADRTLEDSDWTMVRRSGRTSLKWQRPPCSVLIPSRSAVHAETTVVETDRSVARVHTHLAQFPPLFVKAFKSQITAIVQNCVRLKESQCDSIQLVLFGLGSPSQAVIPQIQLALFLLVESTLSDLGVIIDHVKVYDPLFTSTDKAVLHALFPSDSYKLTILEDNNACRFQASSKSKTLFFLPHLDHVLTNNLLDSNSHQTPNLILLSNRLSLYLERDIHNSLSRIAPVISQLLEREVVREVELPLQMWYEGGGREGVVNDLGWVWFDV